MSIFNKKIGLTCACAVALFLPHSLSAAGVNSTLAACGAGGQCVIDDGSTLTLEGGHYFEVDGDPALRAQGAGSHIIGKDLKIDNGSDPLDDAYFEPVVQVVAGGKITLENSNIKAYQGVRVWDEGSRFTMLGGVMMVEDKAIDARDGAVVRLQNVTISKDGTQYDSDAVVNVMDSSLEARNLHMTITDGSYQAAIGISSSFVELDGVDLQIQGEGMAGLAVDNVNGITQGESGRTKIFLKNAQMNVTGSWTEGVHIRDYLHLLLEDTHITVVGVNDDEDEDENGFGTGILVNTSSLVEMKGGSINVVNGTGLVVSNKGQEGDVESRAILDNAKIVTLGDQYSHGLHFAPAPSIDNQFYIGENIIQLKNNSLVDTPDASAVFVDSFDTNLLEVENSRLSGKRLVTMQKAWGRGSLPPSNLHVKARGAELFGGTFMEEDTWLRMDLAAGTNWRLHASGQGYTQSAVSFLSLQDSHISFATPVDFGEGELYQTLFVGAGRLDGATDVYKAGNGARISFNSYLNEGGELDNQFTDRLLVNGDVSGVTWVSINQMAGSPGGDTSPSGAYLNNEGISLVQVSGQAEEKSFQLEGGYTALAGQPWVYKLYAYGPGAARGEADRRQNLLEEFEDGHWDFRLHSIFMEEDDELFGDGGGAGGVRQVVPQVPSYLIAPNLLMQAGLLDIGNLHRRLGDIRATLKHARYGAESQAEYFLVGYNGDYDYRSNLARTQYGYGADLRYGAMQIGGNIFGAEGANSLSRFGLSASRGGLKFDPRQVVGSGENDFSTWRASVHYTYLHDSGFYLDAIGSYGGFGGHVATPARGRTAKIGGHSIIASLEMGMPFSSASMQARGLEFEPQLQLVYQYLDFNSAYDKGDNFRVDLGSHDQILARIGGHLTKKFTNTLSHREASIYAKLHYVHALNEGKKVRLGDEDFVLSNFGNHIEAGLGFNALLSDATALYGEAIWQERVGNAGFSGIRFNGGIRVQF